MNNQDMNNPHLWLEEEINLDKSYALYFNTLNSNKFFFPLEIYFFHYHYGKCSSIIYILIIQKSWLSTIVSLYGRIRVSENPNLSHILPSEYYSRDSAEEIVGFRLSCIITLFVKLKKVKTEQAMKTV